MDDDRPKGFSIKDHRSFSVDGEPDQTGDDDSAGKAAEGVSSAAAEEPGIASAGGMLEEDLDDRLPHIDFSTFVLSLGTSAMYHLGAIPDPDTNTPSPNLPLAKQTIDIIAMLKVKTEGNLDKREKKLVSDLLYDLRIRYVQSSQSAGTK